MKQRLPAMYFYVDHTSQFPHNTGIQRCVRLIAKSLIKLGINLCPVCWDPAKGFVLPTAAMLDHLACWNGPAVNSWHLNLDNPQGLNWILIVELVRAQNKPSPQMMKSYAATLGLQVAWVFHDAIPLRRAHFYGGHGSMAAQSHAAYMRGLASADLVLANSSHLCDFLRKRKLPFMHVVGLPLAHEFPGKRSFGLQQVRTKGEPLKILCVGSLEQRKNHKSLLKALSWLSDTEIFSFQLKVVGWSQEPVVVEMIERAINMGLPIEYISDADDDCLSDLYEWAHVSAYPSVEEGFGLPVAESLWRGRGCICSGEGALGELASGGGCIRVDVNSWQDIAKTFLQLEKHPKLLAKLTLEINQRELRCWKDYGSGLLNNLFLYS